MKQPKDYPMGISSQFLYLFRAGFFVFLLALGGVWIWTFIKFMALYLGVKI